MLTRDPIFWLALGFVGQAMFTLRFVVQWLASERSGTIVVPASFWWLSIAGAVALLSYAIYRLDPVFIVGQSLGVFVYVRNLKIASGGRGSPREAAGGDAAPRPHIRAEAAEAAAARG